MRVPDPKANTTTEAYLAYKAGYLEENELKPVLYEPYLHFDAWLAYWAGLTDIYPNNGVPIGKNLFNKKEGMHGALLDNGKIETIGYPFGGVSGLMKVEPGETYVVSGRNQWHVIGLYDADKKWIRRLAADLVTIPDDCYWIRVGFQWPVDLDTVQVEEGDTATTYEVFKGEPEMLCDEEALVAYLAGVTNTYPEEIKDPYDVRIVGYLKHLVSVRWPEPDYPVNNEEFYLSTMSPAVVPSGDTPSSDIEMDDTAEYPFIDLGVYGDTSQNVYTGKNLLKLSSGVTGRIDDNSFERYVTPDIGATVFTTLEFQMKPNTTYTLSFKKVITGSSQFRTGEARYREGTSGWGSNWSGDTDTLHFTTNNDGVFGIGFYLVFQATASERIDVKWYDIQIEEGETATSFEPYTGEEQAPAPLYPQPVNKVTGRQVIATSGKNLLAPVISSYYPNNGDMEYSITEDGRITMEAVGTAGSQLVYVTQEVPDASKTYVLSGYAERLSHGDGGEERYEHLYIRYQASNDGVTWGDYSDLWMQREPLDEVVYKIENATVSGYKFYRFLFYNYTANNAPIGAKAIYYDLQLEEGDTPTRFSEYKAPASYEINLGKNLFDKSKEPIVFMNATAEELDTGVRVKVANSAGTFRAAVYKILNVADYVGYTITLSTNMEVSRSGNEPYAYIGHSKADGSDRVVKASLDSSGSVSYKIVNDADRPCLILVLYATRETSAQIGDYADFTNVQVEISPTATEYAPYFEPIELLKIGDHQDYIYRNGDGDWFIKKAIGKLTFTGAEGWNRQAIYDTETRLLFGFNDTADIKDTMANRKGLSSMFIFTPLQASEIDVTGIYINQAQNYSKYVYIKIPKTYLDTEDNTGFKKWLSENNVTLYYQKTESDVAITNSSLIAQLDALMEGGSYDDKTFIKVTATDNLPAGLIVVAAKYD